MTLAPDCVFWLIIIVWGELEELNPEVDMDGVLTIWSLAGVSFPSVSKRKDLKDPIQCR